MAIEQMLAFGNGRLFFAFIVLVIGLVLYAIYYLVFRLDK